MADSDGYAAAQPAAPDSLRAAAAEQARAPTRAFTHAHTPQGKGQRVGHGSLRSQKDCTGDDPCLGENSVHLCARERSYASSSYER